MRWYADKGSACKRGEAWVCRGQVIGLPLDDVPRELWLPQTPRPEFSGTRWVRAGVGSFEYIECVDWGWKWLESNARTFTVGAAARFYDLRCTPDPDWVITNSCHCITD